MVCTPAVPAQRVAMSAYAGKERWQRSSSHACKLCAKSVQVLDTLTQLVACLSHCLSLAG